VDVEIRGKDARFAVIVDENDDDNIGIAIPLGHWPSPAGPR
jgi:hypothetical protein